MAVGRTRNEPARLHRSAPQTTEFGAEGENLCISSCHLETKTPGPRACGSGWVDSVHCRLTISLVVPVSFRPRLRKTKKIKMKKKAGPAMTTESRASPREVRGRNWNL